MTDTTTTEASPRPPCPVCGSTDHAAGGHFDGGSPTPTGYHDNSEPTGYYDSSVAGDAEWVEG